MRTALFRAMAQRVLVILYRRLGTISRSHLLGFLTLEDGVYGVSRDVGKEFHFLLRNSPEDRKSQEKEMLGLGKSPYGFNISLTSPEIPLIARKVTGRAFFGI